MNWSFCKRAFLTGLVSLGFIFRFSGTIYAAGEFRTVEIEALRIAIDSEWAPRTAPGYWPIRFDITNLGNDRKIEIVGQGNRWWNTGDSGTSELHQSLALKRGDRKRFTISIPVFANNESIQFQIRENSKILQSFSYTSVESNSTADEASVLVVGDSATSYRGAAVNWLRPLPTFGRGFPGGVSPTVIGTIPRVDLMLDPSRLPADWLGYASLRAVLLGPEQWNALEGPQREALLEWIACGGDLFFVDGDPKTLVGESARTLKSHVLNQDGPLPYFFGRIYRVNSSSMDIGGLLAAIYTSRNGKIDMAYALPANRHSRWLTFADRGFRLSIPGVGGIPVRSYLAILIVFSVLIAPVNYVVLWRKKRQVLLVLTTPLISILFIALLAGYAVLGEGLGIHERSDSFTILDQSKKHAATRASVSMYAAGMAPWNGLRFPRETAIFPVGTDGKGTRDRVTLELSETQQFSSGIVRARAPSNFEEISFRPARERLTFNRSGETVEVVNGLGATIIKLFYKSNGKGFSLDKPLRDGEKGSLHVGDLPPGDVLARSGDAGYDDVYVAFIESSPFLDFGTKVDERGSQHVVLGYTGGPQ